MVQIATTRERRVASGGPTVRQQEILRAASRVFRRQGLHATGMRDIAAELGMAVGNLYYYFRSKEELLAFCQEETLTQLLALTEVVERLDLRPDARLYRLIVGHVVCLNEGTPGSLAHLEVEALAGERRERIQALRDRYEEAIRSIISHGISQGLFRPADPKVTALAILGALNWTVKWFRPEGPKSAQEIGREFGEYLLRGLLAPGVDLEIPGELGQGPPGPPERRGNPPGRPPERPESTPAVTGTSGETP